MLLLILSTVSAIAFPQVGPEVQVPHEASLPNIPVQTDDGLDPVTLVWTGFAPAWWVAANIVGWSDSAYCSGPKTVNGANYNYTLEHPDQTGIACFGPRDHVRIWDMGTSPVFGQWSIGSAHHEHTVCDPTCHHVVDSWERAQADVRSSFVGEQATVSVSNLTLANARYFQSVYNDGNATLIQLKPPEGAYPVIFNENGLSNRTSWSVTMNGTTLSSPHPDITFSEPNGSYLFSVSVPPGYDATPSSGTITVNGARVIQSILFKTPWATSSTTVYSTHGRAIPVSFSGNATVATSSVRLTTTGITTFSFRATEIGSKGVLNVTIPKSATPSNSLGLVYLDGTRDDFTMITKDSTNYYVYFLLPYGAHSVELQFVPQTNPYIGYVIVGAISVAFLGALFAVVRMKKRA